MENRNSDRDIGINYFKSFLIIGMIWAHSLQILSPNGLKIIHLKNMSLFINLITFSGFFFAFGYVYYKAYIVKYDSLGRKYLKTCFKILMAFYISGILFKLTVTPGKWIDLKGVLNILVLRDVVSYSEFLLAFFVLTVLFYIFFKPIKKYAHLDSVIIGGIIFSLAMTFFPYDIVKINQLGLIIGAPRSRFAGFPVIQYLSLFLIGLHFAKNEIMIKKKYIIISVAATMVLVVYFIMKHGLPTRFPPSIYWVLGSWAFLYAYYLCAQFLSKIKYHFGFLNLIGENAMFFLILSNVLIFSLKKAGEIQPYYTFPVALLIIIAIYYLATIVRKPDRYLNR